MNSKKKPIMQKFAKYFDLIYHDKNYKKECRYIKNIIAKKKINANKILDLGCGTGNHSIILSKMGYELTGIDFSSDAIRLAKEKSKNYDKKIKFVCDDMIKFSLSSKFDACISMFSSICYLENETKLKTTFENVHKHLKNHGLLIFDFWNGNGVIRTMPSKKTKIITKNNLKITRKAIPTIDLENQRCSINYQCLVREKNQLIDSFNETHTMRYYFLAELRRLLNESGFQNIAFFPALSFSSLNNKKLLDNWYLYAVAQK